ncbi:MAG: CPBP family intramembrane metalloprotease [Lachnospiraceae bacterium]|nr:CPBP family intramembrane metalloprotease [Lachnospiraceae bacterium]
MLRLRKEKLVKRTPKAITILFVKMFVMGIAIEMTAAYILSAILNFMPEVSERYNSNISTLKQFTPEMLIYVCLLAPIIEELIFRGLILGIIKKFAPFIVANITQAIVFGIYHGNWVQGIYAFLLGILIGYVAYITGSIVYTIVLHMGVNISGILIDYIIPEGTNGLITLFIALISLLVIVGIIKGINNDRLADC